MKNNDEILKYLADMMTETEKSGFEKRVSQSEDLKSELERHQNSLKELNAFADIKEESPYFQNLLPRVRARMEKEKKLKWIPRLGYLVPTFTAILLIVINIGKFSPVKEQVQMGAVSENTVPETTSVGNSDLYSSYNLVSGNDALDQNKKENTTFEVGVSEIASKESIKEVAKARISYPVEEYLLALR
jgi:hypothetical protein